VARRGGGPARPAQSSYVLRASKQLAPARGIRHPAWPAPARPGRGAAARTHHCRLQREAAVVKVALGVLRARVGWVRGWASGGAAGGVAAAASRRLCGATQAPARAAGSAASAPLLPPCTAPVAAAVGHWAPAERRAPTRPPRRCARGAWRSTHLPQPLFDRAKAQGLALVVRKPLAAHHACILAVAAPHGCRCCRCRRCRRGACRGPAGPPGRVKACGASTVGASIASASEGGSTDARAEPHPGGAAGGARAAPLRSRRTDAGGGLQLAARALLAPLDAHGELAGRAGQRVGRWCRRFGAGAPLRDACAGSSSSSRLCLIKFGAVSPRSSGTLLRTCPVPSAYDSLKVLQLPYATTYDLRLCRGGPPLATDRL
jgi:hypothetical protein